MSYLPHVADENELPTLQQIKDAFGFVPNFYLAQTIRPDLIDAEAQLVGATKVRERIADMPVDLDQSEIMFPDPLRHPPGSAQETDR